MASTAPRLFAFLLMCAGGAFGAGIAAKVDFARHLREWDGFGVNYVETCQTRDYAADPQEYGGFSILDDRERREIMQLTFGEDGLKPSLVKMFLDPFHEPEEGRFDHQTTTKWMRYFAREGLAITRRRGGDLAIITTLYGPPARYTKQRILRGRDLDPAGARGLAAYMVSWVKYLRQTEKLPVKYLSLHNEGEDWVRWPADGGAFLARHDYNLYWPVEQVNDFLILLRPMLDAAGLRDVGLAPGETSNWTRFDEWGYAAGIAANAAAVKSLGLITSHGFVNFGPGRWFGDWRSTGNDILREKNPRLHSWVTSQSWGRKDDDTRVVNVMHFLNVIRGHIYTAKVNGIIPWAAIQRPAKWEGGDPNAAKVFGVDENGEYSVQPAYHYYKQVSRAGQAKMAVAHVESNDTEIGLIAFARNGTQHPDAFVLLNLSSKAKPVTITVAGSAARVFHGYRTSEKEQYADIGRAAISGGSLEYTAPPGSATTFYAVP